ncbi:MAG: FHA domain-containing protein [Myxococcota bacterium]
MPNFHLQWGEQKVALAHGTTAIGRGSDCDLVLEDSMVSRRHCLIHASEAAIRLEDLGSRNGVLVNGTRVHRFAALAEGDRITIGRIQLQVTVVEDTSDGPPTIARETIPHDALLPESQETAQGSIFEMFVGSGRRAFDEHDIPAAENVTGNLCVSLRASLVRGKDVGDTFDQTVDFCFLLAERTGSRKWIEKALILHEAGKRLPSESSLLRMEELKAAGVHAPRQLRAFVEAASEFAPDDPTLPRLEQLAGEKNG